MTGVLAVLGGSSPFNLGLAEAIAEDPPWAEGTVRLHGRDEAALTIVARCAAHLLAPCGWSVEATTDLATALAGADVVLHQNRYGGLEWRERDEQLALAHGLAPDETLGPGGLSAGLRTGHGQRPFEVALGADPPRLMCLTTTNPLGVSTACFARAGIATLGICEVPELTRLAISALLGEPVSGCYTGLNHRGFWHHLRTGREDAWGPLLAALDAGSTLPGADPATLRELEAVPDKYHPLLRGGSHLPPGRAAELADLRLGVLAEADADPTRVPASLASRDMPWHRHAVLPVLRGLTGTAITAVVTVPSEDGTALEQQVLLQGTRRSVTIQSPPPAPVQTWYDVLRAHERAVMAAVVAPSTETVHAALLADPTVPDRGLDALATATFAAFDQWRAGLH